MTFHVEHSGLFATAMLYRERHNIRVLQKLGSPDVPRGTLLWNQG